MSPAYVSLFFRVTLTRGLWLLKLLNGPKLDFPVNTHASSITSWKLKKYILFLVCFLFGTLVVTTIAKGQIDGIVEPFRQIELSSEETGTILELNVEVGDEVERDQVIARLDDRLQTLQYKLAKEQASFTAKADASQKTLEKRKSILERVRQLNDQGHAGPSELLRAEMEHSIAHARWRASEEEQIERDLECEQARLKLERRRIRAPHSGIVSLVYRREGEFVSPVQPEVIRLVQIDKVLAVFAVEQNSVSQFRSGQTCQIKINGTSYEGRVHEIGVQADAKSRTVSVKFLIDNTARKLRSGEICTLNLTQ